jgi:hypothetical protein
VLNSETEGVAVLCARKRTTLPCTVPAELQLKYQDSGSTVTNWDRIRLKRRPNYSL